MSGQLSPGSLHRGQVPSKRFRQIPQCSSSPVFQRHTATAFQLLTWTSMARGQEVLQLSQDSISVVILQANALHVHNYRKKFSKGEMTSSALNVSAFRPGCDPHLYLGYLSRKLAIAARHSICNDYVQGKTTNIPQEHLHLLKHEGTLMHFS
eukprot:scpid37483/ scgid4295/ 